MLEEEFLKPLGLTKYRLAKDIGVPLQPIGDIVAGKRSVRAGIDLPLCRYFGLSVGWWLRGQEKIFRGTLPSTSAYGGAP
jgi:addiction module HigA family antidote